MKKPYRNALRSKQMIQNAFIELLAEKPIERITVVDIVNRSDLSRNTFYAHYQDVYAVLEEYQQKGLDLMTAFLDEAVANREFSDVLPLLQKVAEHVEQYKNIYRSLLNAGQDADAMFTTRLKQLLADRIIANLNVAGVRDRQGLLVFVDVLATGFFHLFKQYLRDEGSLTSDEIVHEINRIYQACVPIYQ